RARPRRFRRSPRSPLPSTSYVTLSAERYNLVKHSISVDNTLDLPGTATYIVGQRFAQTFAQAFALAQGRALISRHPAATTLSRRLTPELLVKHRPAWPMALAVGCPIVVLAGFGSSATSSAGGSASTSTSTSSAAAGTPVK